MPIDRDRTREKDRDRSVPDKGEPVERRKRERHGEQGRKHERTLPAIISVLLN